MRNYELEMMEALEILENSGCLWGVKAEFEAEGTRFLELIELARIARRSGTRLAVKVGGAEAVRDLDELKRVGVEAVIAPMIESAYAVKKNIDSIERVFAGSASPPQFLINFETSGAWENRVEILESVASSPQIRGIVFGRVDFSLSTGLKRDDINQQSVLEVALFLATELARADKLFVIGGGVSELSFPFLAEAQAVRLDRFETRKVVFNAAQTLAFEERASLIRQAMRFEIAWLRFKREQASSVLHEDEDRVKMLEERWLGGS
mgnify:CR=1 FL=1